MRNHSVHPPVRHRHVWTNLAAVMGEYIGGVTLDLAMAKLARLAMAARGVTLSLAIQPPVTAWAVVRFYTWHPLGIRKSLGHPPLRHRCA